LQAALAIAAELTDWKTTPKKCGVGNGDPKSPFPTPSPRFCGRWSEYASGGGNGQDYGGNCPLV